MESNDRVQAALKPRVLYLEKRELVANTYKRYLSVSADVRIVASPRDARQALQESRVDLVLTDSIGLPLLPHLREEYPTLPVIVLSGGEVPERLPEGVRAWYLKPVDSEILRTLVTKYAKGILE